nr:hypothetical protein [Tanacetum cinerariifolium]
NVEDKILVPKLPKNYARCRHPVEGPYCQGCTLLRKKLEEDLVTYFQNFQNTFESSDDSTNVVNAPREPFVVRQDHGVNPPHIDECCCECGEALDGIFCQQFTCKSCGKGAHIGYNCLPKVPIISNLEPGPHETFHCQPPQYTVDYPIFNAHNDLLTSQTTIMEQMTTLTSMCEMVCQIFQKKQEEKQIEEEQAASARYWKILACCDDDDDYNSAITPVLSIEEPVDSLTLKDNPTPSSEVLTKSSSTSPKSFLEETNTFHNSLPEFESFCFDLEEISSGSTTTHSDISLPDYEVFYFYDDHIEEISSGSFTTHSNISLSEYDSFIFDLQVITFLLPIGVTLLMSCSVMNLTTSYLHRSMIVSTLGICPIRVS